MTPPRTNRGSYDVVVVGAGHNGLAAAAYLARAGRSVLVLEALDHVGGATISAEVFPGVQARLSRYSYLVSLLPRQVVGELGLDLQLRRRRYSSYTPVQRQGRPTGLLVDAGDEAATRRSFADVTGGHHDHDGWRRFAAMTGRVARVVFPTLTEPLLSRDELRCRVGDDTAWEAVFERPVGEVIEETFDNDDVRGVVLTDALIGTFAQANEASLRQNRCFLYHVIGGGTGDWAVPVAGMGAVSGALERSARDGGAELRTSARVTGVDPGTGASVRRGARTARSGARAEVTYLDTDGTEHRVGAGHVLCGAAPTVLAELLGRSTGEPAPEGAQLKVNLLVRRLPRLLDRSVDPVAAFSGTFHANESYRQLQAAYDQAAAGRIPDVAPCEVYCHSLTDRSILGPDLDAAGAHTLTVFGLHMPARLFTTDPDGARQQALAAILRSIGSVLAEPVEDCLWLDSGGTPCLEVATPVDLENDVGLPGGNIFHRDLSWPFAEDDEEVGRWGVETADPRVLLCGAGARRGGGVSAVPGRAAAMAVLQHS